MLRAGSRWRDIQASADHLCFNQLEDRIKPIRRKVRMGQKAFSQAQLRMTPLERFRVSHIPDQTSAPGPFRIRGWARRAGFGGEGGGIRTKFGWFDFARILTATRSK